MTSSHKGNNLEALGLLTRCTTHELSNQLMAILGFAQLTIDALPESDPLRQNLEEIKEQGERAVMCTRELAKLARMLAPIGVSG